MRLPRPLHAWTLSPREAIAVQEDLARRVRLEPLAGGDRLIAGCDVAFDRVRGLAVAAVVLWDSRRRAVVEERIATAPLEFPYVPGLLSFREGPALLAALGALEEAPDVLLFDGQGIAHPRRLGLAAHLGLWLDLPAVGCAKSRLVGEHREPGPRRGATARLVDRGEVVGVVLRTRDRVRPVWVSPGHRIDVDGARSLVLRAATRYRLPEPTRLADQLVARAKRDPSAR